MTMLDGSVTPEQSKACAVPADIRKARRTKTKFIVVSTRGSYWTTSSG